MSIIAKNGCFALHTAHTSYVMGISEYGHLLHLHYGGPVSDLNLFSLYPLRDRAFAPCPASNTDRTYSLDSLPLEYTFAGVGDFRVPAGVVCQKDGSRAAELIYQNHSITNGVIAAEDLPSARLGQDPDVQTLTVSCKDSATDLQVDLIYTVFPQTDVIVRFAKFYNNGQDPITLEQADSLQLDLPDDKFDLLQFYGSHAAERKLSRSPLHPGLQGFESRRGASSHQHNPFFCLCRPTTCETSGDAYSFHFIYSGSYQTQIQVDQYHTTRCVMGLGSAQFSWQLLPGQSFSTPQAILSFSNRGLGALSRGLHRFIKAHILAPQWQSNPCPILINNWEATYFDFDEDKLVQIAQTAANLGVELFVMDDGWFGNRTDDARSLGDWYPNLERLPGGLAPLAKRIRQTGMDFGLWMEPEMISPDSDLYRAHPDWCLAIPTRDASLSRAQLVLNLGLPQVQAHLLKQISEIVTQTDLRYLKWDCNRHLTEVYSPILPPDRQKETHHRYMLGLYWLLEQLTARFPQLRIEGCAGGGGKFDAGMLYYCPQIWASDDTDPIERTKIQYGGSFGYPLSTMGSHVSASPNHQTGSQTPIQTRAHVAFGGAFGYELDLNRLSEAEKQQIPTQCAFYKKHANLFCDGAFMRLANPFDADGVGGWGFASSDGKEMLVFAIRLQGQANPPHLRFGLPLANPTLRYEVDQTGQTFGGDTLQHAGLLIPLGHQTGDSVMLHLKAVD